MIADFHNDILTVKKSQVYNELQDLNLGVLALYKGKRTFEELFSIASDYKGKHKLAFEDIGGVTDAQLEKLISFSPVYVTLSWNFENDLAYGCYSNGKLKARGRTVVKKLVDKGIFIDCAHLSKKSFLALYDLTDYIINSHTCFSAINKHLRNIDDEQLSLLRAINSCVGITFVGSFLTRDTATSDSVIRHIEHYVQKFGTQGLAIGSDYYGTNDLPNDLQSYKQWYILFEKLSKLGYTKQQIDDIIYINLNILINKD